MLVLVVADDDETRLALANTLAAAGHMVETARDARQAFTKAALLAPDAVLLSLALSGMGATTVAQRLRTHLHTHDIPIVAVAAATTASRSRAVRIGCDAFAATPCEPAALLSAIESVQRRRARVTRSPFAFSGRRFGRR